MRFLLLAYGDESKSSALTEGEMRALGERCSAYDEELKKTGRLVASGSLGWGARKLRLERGKLRVTDGPFIETKEQLGGIVILEVRDLDEALAWAERTPWNRDGCVTEIRPVMDYDAYAARAAAATGERAAS